MELLFIVVAIAIVILAWVLIGAAHDAMRRRQNDPAIIERRVRECAPAQKHSNDGTDRVRRSDDGCDPLVTAVVVGTIMSGANNDPGPCFGGADSGSGACFGGGDSGGSFGDSGGGSFGGSD